VKIGDGPAAVIPPPAARQGEPDQPCTSLLDDMGGKAAEREGKSENLPGKMSLFFVDGKRLADPIGYKREIPGSKFIGPGIFLFSGNTGSSLRSSIHHISW